MKILMLLSKEFSIDPRVYHESISLHNKGHQVMVIMWDRKNSNFSEENIDGIDVLRIKNNKIMNVIPKDILRIPFWWRLAYKKALKLYKKNLFKFDVVHCHDLDTLQIGVWLKKKLHIKLIYDSHEIFSYMIAGSYPKFVAKSAFSLEKRLVKYVDSIITVAEPHAKYFRNICDKPVTLVRNCKQLFTQTYIPSTNNICTVLYIGNLNEGRFLKEAIEVCSNIERIRFKIAGFGSLEAYIKGYIREKNISNIEFVGIIPMNLVLSETVKSDIVFCVFDPNKPNNQVGPPNKIFEAMVCGRPVIATKNIYSGDLVQKLDMGRTTDYTKNGLKNVLVELRDNPLLREQLGKNALKAAIAEFNWPLQEKQLYSVYFEIKAK
jgi:glycosyltransferase involved in cell wall biosynthesis